MKVTGHDASVTSFASAKAQDAQKPKESEPTRATERAGAGLDASAAAGATSVSFSEKVQEVQQIAAAAKAEPEVRQDVVEQAKLDIASGQMQADPSELAAQIARDLF
jgi:flagellar biosynthesis anti-sigma factor FlgM